MAGDRSVDTHTRLVEHKLKLDSLIERLGSGRHHGRRTGIPPYEHTVHHVIRRLICTDAGWLRRRQTWRTWTWSPVSPVSPAKPAPTWGNKLILIFTDTRTDFSESHRSGDSIRTDVLQRAA